MARPREFDPEEALDAIMETFWRLGYEGASMRDLVAATGLHKGSLYAAFGGKAEMYARALARYGSLEVAAAIARLRVGPGETGRDAISRFLGGIAEAVRVGVRPVGCFMCNASVDRACVDGSVGELVARANRDMEKALEGALEAVPGRGRDTPGNAAKARALLAVYYGMQVLARSGAEPATLAVIRDSALGDLDLA